VDEGLLQITTSTNADDTFGHTAPTATKLTVKQGTTTYLNGVAATAGTPVSIWLPTNVVTTFSSTLATPDAFWSDDSDTATLSVSGDGDSPKVVGLDLDELGATLVVNVSGYGSGQASLTVTPPSGQTVPTGVPTATSGGSASFYLPAGDWTITATRSGQSDNGTRSITSPTGSYTLNLVIPAPPASAASAGKPGSFSPSGAVVPADLAAMSTITASPATPWTTGQYVALGDGSNAYWNGTAWSAGESPAASGATAGEPGSFTPAGADAPANLAAMNAGGGITASPSTAWATDKYVVLDDNSKAYWNGSTWKAGKAP
jgi:hypothetical protein